MEGGFPGGLRVVIVPAHRPAAGHDQRVYPLRVVQREVQRDLTAYRQSQQVNAVELQMVNQRQQVGIIRRIHIGGLAAPAAALIVAHHLEVRGQRR